MRYIHDIYEVIGIHFKFIFNGEKKNLMTHNTDINPIHKTQRIRQLGILPRLTTMFLFAGLIIAKNSGFVF